MPARVSTPMFAPMKAGRTSSSQSSVPRSLVFAGHLICPGFSLDRSFNTRTAAYAVASLPLDQSALPFS